MPEDTKNSGNATPSHPEPSIPKPNIPTPNVPSPSIPKPNIPTPNVPSPSVGGMQAETPRVSSFEVDDPTNPAQQSAQAEDDTVAEIEEEDSILHKRLGAAAIDILVAYALYFILAQVLPGMIAWAINLVYLLTRDCLPFLDGQSLGKKALGLRAVTEDGQSLSGQWQPGILRNILLAIPAIGPIVELIILYTREDSADSGLRLGDGFANTKVVTVASLTAETSAIEDATEEE